ncbi:MAG: universal stress protein [Blastocatellia bacterium]|nr:universal stress protein [Blastocatellia bacterium]
MKVLVATDGSIYADAAVKAVASRLWPADTEIRLMMVLERPAVSYITSGEGWMQFDNITKDVRTAIKAILDDSVKLVQATGCQISEKIREGDAADEIISEIEDWGADLVVVGTHGRRGLSRFLLGSVAQRVATHSPCSVEIVKVHEK